MSSLKDNTRAAITTAMIAALATAIFTGCNPSTPSTSNTPSVPTPPSSVSSTTSSTPEDSTSGGTADANGNTVLTDEAASHITNVDIPATPSDNDSKPEQSTTSTTSTPESKPEPAESKPEQSTPSGSKPTQSSSSKPTESTPASSSSTPTQSTPAPTGQTTASGEAIIKGKYTGYKPTDTTGMELDSKGFPVDDSETNYRPFVDSTGQLWEYDPGAGWELASSGGGVIDHSGYVDPDLPNIKPGH